MGNSEKSIMIKMMKKTLTLLIKPASSLCNMKCRYCFYADVSELRETQSYGIMTQDTVDLLVERIIEEIGDDGIVNVAFQGGEPTLAGIEYFKHFINELNKYPEMEKNYSLQTNGLLIDEEWCKLFKENRFLIGVSLDGYQANMDHYRIDRQGKGVFYRVLQSIDLLRKYEIDFNILTVLTGSLAKHPKGLYEFYKSHGFDFVQLIPCLPDLADQRNDMSLKPEDYSSFYKDFFELWHRDLMKQQILDVNTFNNLISMSKGMPPYQCGYTGRCAIHNVIEANGDVYPCDFYCLDEYMLGNIKDSSFRELRNSPVALKFLEENICRKEPCKTCRYSKLCNGACRRQNVCFLNDEFCAYQELMKRFL